MKVMPIDYRRVLEQMEREQALAAQDRRRWRQPNRSDFAAIREEG